MNWRAAAAAALAVVAAALSVALVAPEARAAALGFPPPTGIGSAVAMGSLPDCTAVQADAVAASTTGVGLGWTGTWRVAVINGANNYENALAIPCKLGTTGRIAVYYAQRRIAGPGTSFSPRGGWVDLTFSCSTATGVQTTEVVAGNNTNGFTYGGTSASQLTNGMTGANTCPYLVSVQVTLYNVVGSSPALAGVAIWKPSNWTTSSRTWVPGTLAPEGLELPIVCTINNTGADIFELIGNVVGSLVDWPRCMLVPVGWDRAAKINAAWNDGAPGRLTEAWAAAMPDGIVCGELATIDFYDEDVVLDTCTADLLPGWAKAVVSWCLVLGLCALMVHRVLWVVGSKG